MWTDGLHTHILRKMIVDNVRSELFKRHWIIFDGDVEPENSFGAENTGSRTQQPQQPLDDSDDAAAASSSADLTASPARATLAAGKAGEGPVVPPRKTPPERW